MTTQRLTDAAISTDLDLYVRAVMSDGTDLETLRRRLTDSGCATVDAVLRRALNKMYYVLGRADLTMDLLRVLLDPEALRYISDITGVDDDKLDLFVAVQELLDDVHVRPHGWDVVVPLALCGPQHPWVHPGSARGDVLPRVECMTDEAGTWLVLRATIDDVRPMHIADRAFTLGDQLVGLLLATRLLERHDPIVHADAIRLPLPPPLDIRASDDPAPSSGPRALVHDSALGGVRATAIRATRPTKLSGVSVVDRLNGRLPLADGDAILERVMQLLVDDRGRGHQLRAVALLYGRAMRVDDPSERAFYLASALEALFVLEFHDGGARTAPDVAIKERIGTSVARALKRDDEDFRRIRELARTLYDERCGFAHGSTQDVVPTHGAGEEYVRLLLERAVLGDDGR